MTGKKFGKLTVIRRSYPNNKFRNAMWLCRCDCGKSKVINGQHLRKGVTNSCGCLRKQTSKKNAKKNFAGYRGGGRRLVLGLSNFRGTMANYKCRAKKKGLEFNLTEEQFKEITQQDCYYCGEKPNQIFNHKGSNGDYIYNGIDRIDNTKGYTINNIVPCCGFCNMAKKSHTEQEFKDWVKRIYNKMFTKK